jgi:CIC family chloride channel protein
MAPQPAAYALVGMGAFLGGIGHVPLAAVIIVCELAGNYQLLVPLMSAGGVAYLLLRRTTLYPQQAKTPAASPARVGAIAVEVLDTLCIRDMDRIRPAPKAIRAEMGLTELIAVLGDQRTDTLPIADADGRIREMVTLKALRSVLDYSPLWTHLIATDASSPAVTARVDDSLRVVMERLIAAGTDELFVVDANGQLLGVVGHIDVAQLALRETVRRRVGSEQCATDSPTST